MQVLTAIVWLNNSHMRTAAVLAYAYDSVPPCAESESFLLEAWMALVGQALVPRGRSWAVRIISLSAGLFGVVILAAYTANLAAILTDTSASTAISRCKHMPMQSSPLIISGLCLHYPIC